MKFRTHFTAQSNGNPGQPAAPPGRKKGYQRQDAPERRINNIPVIPTVVKMTALRLRGAENAGITVREVLGIGDDTKTADFYKSPTGVAKKLRVVLPSTPADAVEAVQNEMILASKKKRSPQANNQE